MSSAIEEDKPARARILGVDDDAVVRLITRTALEQAGFEVWLAASAEEALVLLEERGLPHLALIDIKMPGMSGIELGRRILDYSDVPIIMLTSVDDVQTIVETIDEVAEDYVTKPFEPAEVVARVRRLLRRVGDFSYVLSPRIHVDDRLQVELARRMAIVEGEPVELTPTETKLLYTLMRRAPQIVSNEVLLQRVWPGEKISEDSLRTHFHRLRRKIEVSPKKPRYVLTRRGRGYCFFPDRKGR